MGKNDELIECPHCERKMFAKQKEEMNAHKNECRGWETSKEKYIRGDTVTYSDFGKKRFTQRKTERKGEVVGFSSKSDDLVRVKWHGNKTAQRYHMDFIKNLSLENLEEEHPKHQDYKK